MPDAAAFVFAHAQGRNWTDVVAACVHQLGTIPAGSNIGFLYATDAFADDLPGILTRLRTATGVEHWTGTVGMGICVTGREYHQCPALAVMLGSFPDDAFRMLAFYDRAADHLPADWEPWLRQSEGHLGLVHGDPANGNLPQLLTQLCDELPGGFLVGGLSSSHGAHPQVADTLNEGGLSGVVFNSSVDTATGMTQGCTPIAERHTITDCDNNIINSLDSEPALDVLKQDIGEVLARDLNRAAGYIFASLPIQPSDTGDYLVRNLMGVDTEGKRIAIGDMVHPGQALQFCRRDGTSAREDMQRMLDALAARLARPPRGGVYVSCLGRGESFFGEESSEPVMIRETLGDFPLVGFFANGEISHHRLYGYTGVLTLFL